MLYWWRGFLWVILCCSNTGCGYISKGPDCADQSRKYLGPFIRAAARSMCRPSVGGTLRNLFKTIISSEWGCPGTSITNRGHKFWHRYYIYFCHNENVEECWDGTRCQMPLETNCGYIKDISKNYSSDGIHKIKYSKRDLSFYWN